LIAAPFRSRRFGEFFLQCLIKTNKNKPHTTSTEYIIKGFLTLIGGVSILIYYWYLLVVEKTLNFQDKVCTSKIVKNGFSGFD